MPGSRYLPGVSIKVYCERNAMGRRNALGRRWLRDLAREGKIVLVLFPHDADARQPHGVQLATPSAVTWDSTSVTCDMTFLSSGAVASEKLEEIRRILRLPNEKVVEAPAGLIGEKTEGDARLLDSAYKSGCRAFITTDRRTVLDHADLLEPLLGLRLFHPREEVGFRAFLDDALQASPPSA